MTEYVNREFRDVSLSGEDIYDTRFEGCTFENCVIEQCRLAGCELSECVFRRCRFSGIKPDCSSLEFAVFEDCAIAGVSWTLWKPDNMLATIFDRFERCTLRFCTFADMELAKFSFEGCGLASSLFSDSRLQKASFRGCSLDDTEFIRCDLRGADFRDAAGYRIGIMTNKLKGARFSAPEVLSLLGELEIKIDD